MTPMCLGTRELPGSLGIFSAHQSHQEKALGSIAHYSTIEFYIVTKANIVYKASIYKSLLESALQSYRTL
jgi:hypothetical protein